jgi:DNA transposition AAA+ family ATPase
MHNITPNVNRTIAPLKNVSLFTALVDRVMNRSPHLPGMATFHGFSGFGKTFSATYAANTYRAYYVEVGESWTKKKFCQSVLTEMGLNDRGTIPDLVERIIEGLVEENRPLIIDEFDHVVNRRYHETIREIHDKSHAPIILIGEELLPSNLKSMSERFHNRMLDWVPAQPADMEDIRHLAHLYCEKVEIAEDLLKEVDQASQGRVRRICVNLDRIREFAVTNGLDHVDRQAWNDQPMFKGEAPHRRAS